MTLMPKIANFDLVSLGAECFMNTSIFVCIDKAVYELLSRVFAKKIVIFQIEYLMHTE